MGLLRAVGLMSGTSMDGVDAALIETDGETVARRGAGIARPYRSGERALLARAVAAARGLDDRDARPGPLAEAEETLTRVHAEAVGALLAAEGLDAGAVDVVGFHGQTVLHRPERRLTVQLGDGPLLARLTGIAVVHDFRAADVAAGGQGAPLVPVYHRALALAAGFEPPVAVVNIGGVANVTYVGEGADMLAFDTGPGNGPLDDWALAHTGEPMDRDGRLAGAGSVDAAALARLLGHPYFAARPPKSLDRADFSSDAVAGLAPADGAATLVAFTAESVARALTHLPAAPRRWIVVGGGARNPVLLSELRARLSAPVDTADALGWSAAFMEAEAFAYLAARSLRGLPLTYPGTTGVARPTTGGVRAEPVAGIRFEGRSVFLAPDPHPNPPPFKGREDRAARPSSPGKGEE